VIVFMPIMKSQIVLSAAIERIRKYTGYSPIHIDFQSYYVFVVKMTARW